MSSSLLIDSWVNFGRRYGEDSSVEVPQGCSEHPVSRGKLLEIVPSVHALVVYLADPDDSALLLDLLYFVLLPLLQDNDSRRSFCQQLLLDSMYSGVYPTDVLPCIITLSDIDSIRLFDVLACAKTV